MTVEGIRAGPNLEAFREASAISSSRHGEAALRVRHGTVTKFGATREICTLGKTHRKTIEAFVDALKARHEGFASMMAHRLEGCKKLTQGMVPRIIAACEAIEQSLHAFAAGDNPDCSLDKALKAWGDSRGGMTDAQLQALRSEVLEGLRKSEPLRLNEREMFDAVRQGLTPPMREATLQRGELMRDMMGDEDLIGIGATLYHIAISPERAKAIRADIETRMNQIDNNGRKTLTPEEAANVRQAAIAMESIRQRIPSDADLQAKADALTLPQIARARQDMLCQLKQKLDHSKILALNDSAIKQVVGDTLEHHAMLALFFGGEENECSLKGAMQAWVARKCPGCPGSNENEDPSWQRFRDNTNWQALAERITDLYTANVTSDAPHAQQIVRAFGDKNQLFMKIASGDLFDNETAVLETQARSASNRDKIKHSLAERGVTTPFEPQELAILQMDIGNYINIASEGNTRPLSGDEVEALHQEAIEAFLQARATRTETA